MVLDNFGSNARPGLLIAYSDSAQASRCVRRFRRLGWEVHTVASGLEAQRLAGNLLPRVIVLDVDLPDESGWLSAAKILMTHPEQKIVLLAGQPDDSLRDRAQSLGVAGLVRRDDPEAVAAIVFDRQVSVAV